MKRVGIVYNPRLTAAQAVVKQLSQQLTRLNTTFWQCSAWEEENVKAQVPGTQLAISIGGDGTILRVARAIVPWEVPILGINLGKLGFMNELDADEVEEKLPLFISGKGWVDKRTMLEAELIPKTRAPQTLHALNDVVVERGTVPRIINIKTTIDDQLLTTYRADGVIVSTATGSTAYSLAAGGPILYPQAEELLLRPISPHLTMSYSLVLPPSAIIEFEVQADYQAILNIDGQVDLPLDSSDRVRVRRSSHGVHFLRMHPPSSFYALLERKLKGRS